ncbi:MAG: hypothetical protein AAGA83_15625 [Cyanobacteria bacterium P01_F01_bin.116]
MRQQKKDSLHPDNFYSPAVREFGEVELKRDELIQMLRREGILGMKVCDIR